VTAIEADLGLENVIAGFMIVPATCIIRWPGKLFSRFFVSEPGFMSGGLR